MAKTPVLTSPLFWYIFVAAAITSMFALGLRRAADNSLLARARRDITSLQNTIDRTKREKAEISASLAGREQQLQIQNEKLSSLTAELSELRAAVPPYGKSMGMLSIFNGCNCSDLRVWIDGTFAGVAPVISDTTRGCGVIGSITVALPAGPHQVAARDAAGRTWNFPQEVAIDQCMHQTLILRR